MDPKQVILSPYIFVCSPLINPCSCKLLPVTCTLLQRQNPTPDTVCPLWTGNWIILSWRPHSYLYISVVQAVEAAFSQHCDTSGSCSFWISIIFNYYYYFNISHLSSCSYPRFRQLVVPGASLYCFQWILNSHLDDFCNLSQFLWIFTWSHFSPEVSSSSLSMASLIIQFSALSL